MKYSLSESRMYIKVTGIITIYTPSFKHLYSFVILWERAKQVQKPDTYIK